jgi:beta-lactamase regulating signal transducer with metallopeptidase domain
MLSGLMGAALPLLVDSAVKGAALLALAGLLTLVLRKASAAARHLVWLLALAALLLLPMLSAMLPGWRVLPSWTTIAPPASSSPPAIVLGPSREDIPAQTNPTLALESAGTIEPQSGSSEQPLKLADWLPAVWAAGFAVLVFRLLFARWMLMRASRRGTIISEGRLHETMELVRRELQLGSRVRLMLDSERTIPMVWGLFRPTVMLPGEAVDWSEHQVRSVLLHELAHIKRRDLAAQILIHLTCALHWFNPLVWLAAWRLHVEAEHACDNLVLTNGVRASDYAEHVLNVATKLVPVSGHAAGLAMARPSRLEGRMLAVLSKELDRRGVTRTLLLAALVFGIFVIVPVAMLRAGDEQKLEPPQPAAADPLAPGPNPAEPKGAPADAAPADESLTLDVAVDGALSLNGKSVTLKSLSQEVKSLAGDSKPHIDVHVDAGASFNRVVQVFDELEKTAASVTIRTPGKNGVSRIPSMRAARDAEREEIVRQKQVRAEAERDKARRESDLARWEDERARADSVRADVARLKLRQAESQLKRMEQLSADHLVSNSELDQAKLDVARWKAESMQDSKEKLKADLELAEAELALSEANLRRTAELFDKKMIASSEVEMAKAETAIAQAKLRGAKAQLNTAVAAPSGPPKWSTSNPAKKERLLQILNDEIKVAAAQAKLVREQHSQGLASAESLFRAELDVMSLQRERASLDGDAAKAKELIAQQIHVLEELEKATREQQQQGVASESEALKVRRQILMLQRQQAEIE